MVIIMKSCRRRPIVLLALLSLSLFAAVGCAGTGEDTDIPDAATSSAAEVVTEAPTRSATIQTVEGTVEVELTAGAGFEAASVGQVVTLGASVQTGPDGRAVLLLDDETSIVLAEDSAFTLAVMEGTPQTPLTRLFLSIGQVFSVTADPLPEGASYEVETPNGVAAVRGSLMGVGYDPEGDASEVNCLAGTCFAVLGDAEVQVPPGMRVDLTDDGIGELGNMDEEDQQAWGEVLDDLDDAGVPPPDEEVYGEGCSCVGTDLVCEDGTTTPFDALCTGLAGCFCDGVNMVCTIEGETVSFPTPACGGEAPCQCVGTNMVCTYGGETVSFPAPECGGEIPTCTCVGADLVCTGLPPVVGGCGGVPELPPLPVPN